MTKTTTKNEDEDERWKENISKRMRRVEIFMYIVGLFISSSLIDKTWTFQHVSRPKTSSFSENKDTTLFKHMTQERLYNKNLSEKSKFSKDRGDTTMQYIDLSHQIEKKIVKHKVSDVSFFDHTTLSDVLERQTGTSRGLLANNLQDEENLEPCNGTLFHLEIDLDGFAQTTFWELINAESNHVVASHQYTRADRWTTKEFTKCIEPGGYLFALNDDRFGIECSAEKECYKMFIDNELIIQGSQFSGQVVHPFNSSSLCITGTPILLQISRNQSHLGDKVLIRENVSQKLIKLKAIEDKYEDQMLSYFSCLSSGLHAIELENQKGDERFCQDINDCYRVFINSELVFQDENIERKFLLPFYISRSGKAGRVQEKRCNGLPILSPANNLNSFIYDDEMAKTLDLIFSLSAMGMLVNPRTPQYRAACWVLFDDTDRISIEKQYLVERYALGVLFYTIGYGDELLISIATCDYLGITCDREGRIKGISFALAGIQSTIPSELSHLHRLEILDFNFNQMEGTIPPTLAKASSLKRIELNQNKLTGTLPTELGRLKNLEILTMLTNKLTGTIPSEIGLCTKLQKFSVSQNKFVGSIPPELFNCTKLDFFAAGQNLLTGTIPPSIHQLTNIEQLFLHNNHLSGRIPTEIGGLSSVQWITLFTNKLTGPLPHEIGNWNSIQVIAIQNNHLLGSLPNILGNLKNLVSLDLSRNQFTGSIPDSFWDLELIQLGGFRSVNIMSTNLKGIVPNEFCEKASMNILGLNSTGLLVDDTAWFRDEMDINCKCCDSPCNIWDTTKEGYPTCPTSNLHEIRFQFFFGALDQMENRIYLGSPLFRDDESSTRDSFVSDLCLSPTGCYTVIRDNLDIALDHVISFPLSYSASLNMLVQQAECDGVDICGNFFPTNNDKRKGLNHLTQVALNDLSLLKKPLSPQYKAICWIMTQDLLFHNFSICDGTLLQRYVMACFYFTIEHTNLSFVLDFDELAATSTCEWPGVTCDHNGKFIEQLKLSSQNIHGILCTELGLLRNLQTLDLSQNQLHGTIDSSMFAGMENLQTFDIGDNAFAGEIPRGLLMLSRLQNLNIKSNAFVGHLPDDIVYSLTLENFDVGNNLFQGKIPIALTQCHKLQVLDLARNNFNGNIPSTIGDLKNLFVLKLNINRLSGSIPFEIFNPPRIEEMLLQNNLLTGSIPTNLGNLKNSRIIAMNHNLLRGTIPSELSSLHHIEALQFHQNQLTGRAPDIKLSNVLDNSYITDCGEPSFLLANSLECKTCTMCCNSENECKESNSLDFPLEGAIILFLVLLPAIVALKFYSLKTTKNKFFSCLIDNREPLSILDKESVYCLLLSDSHLAKFISMLTVCFQLWLLSIYMRAANIRSKDTDWRYSLRCLGNNLECIDQSEVRFDGWIVFAWVVILYLGKDLIMSFLHVRKAIYISDFRLLLSGLTIYTITALTFLATAYYNLALGESNTDLLTNAVILLFINDLDEKCLSLMILIAPEWTEKRITEVETTIKRKCAIIETPNHSDMYIDGDPTTTAEHFREISTDSNIDIQNSAPPAHSPSYQGQ